MRFKSIVLALAMVATAGPVMAACYEQIGCTDGNNFRKADLRQFSCEVLWDLRNTMYAENGYCFKTKRAINYFGNQQCFVSDMGAVKLNAYERGNVATIQAVEREKGCN